MDRNLIIPTLFVLGFVAVLALTVSPVAEDEMQVYYVAPGDTLKFAYLEESSSDLVPIMSDGGVAIDQRRLITDEAVAPKIVMVIIKVLTPGAHVIQVGEGSRSASFQVNAFPKVMASTSGDPNPGADLYFISPELGISSVVGGEGDDDMFGDDEGLWLTPREKKELRGS